jgi:hypothetical protein
VTLTFCWDLAAADWIVESDLPWEQLVCFGPAGFETYARLRFLPDPTIPGQSENDVEADWRADTLPTLLEVLEAEIAAPDDCYFCVWEGFGSDGHVIDDGARYIHDPSADVGLEQTGYRPGLAPERPSSLPWVPKVVVPNREFWLFRGPLADVGGWDTAQEWPAPRGLVQVEPAFVWPADRTWCVAHDVDPHWAGIGGSRALIDRLIGDPRLDVVPADPAGEQPHYY